VCKIIYIFWLLTILIHVTQTFTNVKYPYPSTSGSLYLSMSFLILDIYRMFQKELYNGIEDVTVWRVLRKRWTVCTPLSVNVFVTPATQ
jgi:hypothetical protein